MLISPKRQASLIIFSTILTAFSLGSIIQFSDPYSAGLVTLIFFYASLFLFTLGTVTLLGLALRTWLKSGLYIINLGISFRQGILVAILVVISFILLSFHILFWWVELSLILFLSVIEIFLNLKL
jgi:hypothetical protein